MELKFFSCTVVGTSCIGILIDELHPLEHAAEAWDFPYNIGCAVRCGINIGKTFRRFDRKDNYLTIDIRLEDKDYMILSKNEQRERLGTLLFSYFAESISKYNKYAAKEQQINIITKIEQWMTDNNWLHGKIEKVRLLLENNQDTYEISRILDMPLEEVEDILLAMYENGERTQVHPDNIKAGKASLCNLDW